MAHRSWSTTNSIATAWIKCGRSRRHPWMARITISSIVTTTMTTNGGRVPHTDGILMCKFAMFSMHTVPVQVVPTHLFLHYGTRRRRWRVVKLARSTKTAVASQPMMADLLITTIVMRSSMEIGGSWSKNRVIGVFRGNEWHRFTLKCWSCYRRMRHTITRYWRRVHFRLLLRVGISGRERCHVRRGRSYCIHIGRSNETWRLYL